MRLAIGDLRLSGIVLAGGASRRMGRDKAWIELDGKFLIERVLDALRQVCSETIIVTNAAGFEGLSARFVSERIVPDEFPNAGSLGGLYSGLNAAENELAFAVACDMPFLNPTLIQELISFSSNYDIVIASAQDAARQAKKIESSGEPARETAKRFHLHPLHAAYRKTCLAPMRDAIARNDLRMISFHDRVRVRVVEQAEIEKIDPKLNSFRNVNTPEELERAELFLRESQGGKHV